MATATQKPIATYGTGNLKIAVWKNDNGNSFSLQKSYKKKDSAEWKNQKVVMFDQDLLTLQDILKNVMADRDQKFKHN